ncbi:hypothetical protein [Yinghuangia seranimata]|uniref:hypothetical protein n=1 Tax=Yinghuangia seranimata TaxID=408067 RepID=UPI00248B6278|nr:hypothetical protein [Yinghuangia seranimata]MDI2132700.1 hypothetical protein [Yinghuangia seranimata]
MAAAVLGIGLLVYGTATHNDDNFPFAPMSMFAFRTDPNGSIDAYYLEANTDSGARVKVPMTRNAAGMARAELEAQLGRIMADPSLLQSIADTQRRLQPGMPHYTRLYVMRERIVLKDGARDHKETQQLVDWQVR